MGTISTTIHTFNHLFVATSDGPAHDHAAATRIVVKLVG
jgi:hypothetical protein